MTTSSSPDELKEFEQRLKNHDWHYFRSDDQKYYREGRTERNILISIAEERGGEFKDLFYEYVRNNLMN